MLVESYPYTWDSLAHYSGGEYKIPLIGRPLRGIFSWLSFRRHGETAATEKERWRRSVDVCSDIECAGGVVSSEW